MRPPFYLCLALLAAGLYAVFSGRLSEWAHRLRTEDTRREAAAAIQSAAQTRTPAALMLAASAAQPEPNASLRKVHMICHLLPGESGYTVPWALNPEDADDPRAGLINVAHSVALADFTAFPGDRRGTADLLVRREADGTFTAVIPPDYSGHKWQRGYTPPDGSTLAACAIAREPAPAPQPRLKAPQARLLPPGPRRLDPIASPSSLWGSDFRLTVADLLPGESGYISPWAFDRKTRHIPPGYTVANKPFPYCDRIDRLPDGSLLVVTHDTGR